MNLIKQSVKTADFKIYLQQQLIERCRKNPSYSLRSFAKSLGIVPSALSDMLNGRRTITLRTIERLGLALDLPLEQIEAFKRVSHKQKARVLESRQKYDLIELDSFALISDWCHYAILELMKIEGFEPSPAWISKVLGISKVEATAAIERLERLRLIRIDGGVWTDISEGSSTNIKPGLTSAASRRLQKQILEKSLEALAEVPIEMRDHTSMTMAIDPDDLPIAIEKIKEFRRGLCELLEGTRRRRDVYQLSISLFPATQIRKIKGEQL